MRESLLWEKQVSNVVGNLTKIRKLRRNHYEGRNRWQAR